MESEGSLHLWVPATCPYPQPDRSSPCPPPTSWRSILILSSNLCLGLPSGLFPSGFPTKTPYTLLPSPYVLRAPPISFFSILSPEQHLVSSTDHSAPHYVVFSITSYLVPLRPKYTPQQLIFQHPQPKFLPQCEWPSFIPLQKSMENYSFVRLNLYIFGQQTGRQKILHRIITNISWLPPALNFFLNRVLIS